MGIRNNWVWQYRGLKRLMKFSYLVEGIDFFHEITSFMLSVQPEYARFQAIFQANMLR